MNNTGINWFKLNRSLHKDLGYLCIGMTLIFAISGIALNHINDWDSNYRVTTQTWPIKITQEQLKQANGPDLVFNALPSLSKQQKVKAQYWQSPTQYKLFLHQATLLIDIQKQSATLERIEPRLLLRSLNFLHLNEAKQAWTWFSDIFALLLIYLAISALFMVKGRKGVIGPRGMLVVIGFILPIGFVLVYAS